MSSSRTRLHESSVKRGLNMGQAYSGDNLFDGGTVASLIDNPQKTTTFEYMRQSEGQNLRSYVPIETIKASNNANLEILADSQKAENAQVYGRAYMSNVLEHPNMKSAAVRKLADPQTLQTTMADLSITNAQSSMLA